MKFQFIGLTPNANGWLKENVKKFPTQICPHCKKSIKDDYEAWVYTKPGIYDAGSLPLWAYMLSDGTIVKETVQTVGMGNGPASEVPLVFLCLRTMDGTRIFEWPKYITRFWKK